MLVTTAGRTNNEMQMLAKRIAAEFNCKFVVREKVSIDYLKLQYQSDILVIGKNRFEFYPFVLEYQQFHLQDLI